MYVSHNYPALKAPLEIGRYAIQIPGYTTRESIYCKLYTDNIDIYPYTEMSKSGGMGQMIVGAVAITVAFIANIAIPGNPASAFLANWGLTLMVFGALTYLLTPKLKNKSDDGSSADNKYLGSPANTTASGTPIPIGYGLFKVHGHYLSFNISSSSLVMAGSDGK
nr:MAG TPA: tail assembly protein [Caudoviricetes sp.]